MERRFGFYLVVAAIVVASYGIVLSQLEGVYKASPFWANFGLYIGPVLVAFGWVFTNEINIRNSRKQHTINLILQYFTNAQRIEDKERIYRNIPADETFDDFDDLSSSLVRTVTRELNYFDFLASAILRREIDGALMERVLRDVVRRHGRTLRPFIEHCRKDSPDTWADFVALYRKWKSPSDPDLN